MDCTPRSVNTRRRRKFDSSNFINIGSIRSILIGAISKTRPSFSEIITLVSITRTMYAYIQLQSALLEHPFLPAPPLGWQTVSWFPLSTFKQTTNHRLTSLFYDMDVKKKSQHNKFLNKSGVNKNYSAVSMAMYLRRGVVCMESNDNRVSIDFE